MNKTVNHFLIKWAGIFIISLIFRIVDGASWSTLVLLSLGTAFANYLIGNMVLLPLLGSLTTFLSEGAMAAVAVVLFRIFSMRFRPSLLAIMLYGVLIVAFEYIFERFFSHFRRSVL